MYAAATVEPRDGFDVGCDDAIRQVHVAGTVLELIGSLPVDAWLGSRESLGIAMGHDSGDFHEIAVIGRDSTAILDCILV